MEYLIGGAIIGGFILLFWATWTLKIKYLEETGKLPPPSPF